MPNSHLSRSQRDLAFCLHSPALIRPLDSRWPSDSWYEQLIPGPEIPPLPPEKFRLGIYFERLIQFWIEHGSYELMASNLQVFNDQKQTLGEFDLILHPNLHWELAIKFYIGVGDLSQGQNWFGRNLNDTLAKKFSKTCEKQLALAHSNEGKKQLTTLGIDDTSVTSWFKGRLFYPYEDFKQNRFEYPEFVNPQHEKAWWLVLEDFQAQGNDLGERFLPLSKKHWLAPIQAQDLTAKEPALTLDEFMQALDVSLLPMQVAALDTDGNELSRGFLISEDWQLKAQTLTS